MNDSSDYYEYSIEHIEYMQEQQLEDWCAYEMLAYVVQFGIFAGVFLNQYLGI